MSELCVFAANFTQTPEVQGALLRESCVRVGIELHEYGIGEGFQGWQQMKIVRALQFLEGRSEPYVLMVDSHDSFVLAGEAEILERYLSLRAEIVISAEKNCWPHAEWDSRYPSNSSPWPYVNSGGVIGGREFFMERLESMRGMEDDDQACWTLQYFNDHQVMLDRHCRLFQTMYGTKPGELSPGVNYVFYTHPLIWHFNGKEGNYPEGKPDMAEWYAAAVKERA